MKKTNTIPTPKIQYLGKWGHWECKSPTEYSLMQYMMPESDICEAMGYSKEDIQAIKSLTAGQVWDSEEGNHTITAVTEKGLEYFELENGKVREGHYHELKKEFEKAMKKFNETPNVPGFSEWAEAKLPKVVFNVRYLDAEGEEIDATQLDEFNKELADDMYKDFGHDQEYDRVEFEAVLEEVPVKKSYMTFKEFQKTKKKEKEESFYKRMKMGDDFTKGSYVLVYDDSFYINIMKSGRHYLVLHNAQWAEALPKLEKRLYEFAKASLGI